MATKMRELSYADAPVKIRDDLAASHARAWRRLAEPGAWLDGATRVAIAAETRNAPSCALCRQRQVALSPYGVDGDHDSLGDLPDATVEVIHRVATDPGRLMERWYQGLLEDGMADAEYVETVGVVVTIVSVDTFARSVGMEPPALPEPAPGAPGRARPAGAKHGGAWVPWVAPEDRTQVEIDQGLYGDGGPTIANIRRALSLVPAEAIGFFDLVEHQYLPGREMRNFGHEFRAITHPQIELIAGRISALNQCLY
jgi:hypothetical protein